MSAPHSAEAEASVVAALLIEPVAPKALAVVQPTDFHVERYRLIYAAQKRLWGKSVDIDVVTLADELKAAGEMDAAGGFDELGHLMDLVPTADNVEHHAKIVAKHARRRDLIRAAQNVVALASGGEDAEVSNAVAALIDTASPRNGGGGFRRIGDGVYGSVERLERIANGDESAKGIQTGFKDVDQKLVGLHPGNLVIVAARPSMGKTAWLLNVLANIAGQGTPCGVVSLEMSRDELTDRAVMAEARVDMQALRNGKAQPEDHQRIAHAANFVATLPLYVDDHPVARLPQLEAKVTTLVRQEGVRLVAIDYLQLMEAEGENRVQEVSRISRGLKNLARRLDVPIIALSQLSRKLEERGDKRPMLSDLRESGSIEQDADTVCFLYRPVYYAPPEKKAELEGFADLIVAKQRNGPTGIVPMYFHERYARFDDLAAPQDSYRIA